MLEEELNREVFELWLTTAPNPNQAPQVFRPLGHQGTVQCTCVFNGERFELKQALSLATTHLLAETKRHFIQRDVHACAPFWPHCIARAVPFKHP